MKFESWLEKWLDIVKPKLKDSSYYRYKRYVRFQIAPEIGQFELTDLSKELLQTFAIKMSQIVDATSAKNIVSLVKRALRYAEETKEVETQYADSICCTTKAAPTKKKCLTEKQQLRLETYIRSKKPDKLFGIVLCLYTGLRAGELLALEWTDLDLKTGIISVTKSCRDGYGEGKEVKVIGGTKTISSVRDIPIPKPLLPQLRELKKSSVSNYVIEGKNGKAVSMRSYFNSLDKILKKLDIPHIGLHGLRHTFATRAIESGMDAKTLSEIMGHSNATITLNVYTHSLSKHKFDMMNRLGKYLKAV